MKNISIQGYQYKDYPELINAIITVKKASFIACKKLHRYDAITLNTLIDVCDKLLSQTNISQMKVSVYAGLKGTLNAIVNECLLKHLDEKKSDYLKVLQSEVSVNAVITTATNIVVRENLLKLAQSCGHFTEVLHSKAKEFENTVKVGRIGLQDYLPMTYGEEFEGYAYGVEKLKVQLIQKANEFNQNALGINELGSQSFFDQRLNEDSTAVLSELKQYKFRPFENLFDSVIGTSDLLLAHATVQALSTVIWKIARDVRTMCSGPRAGLCEITVPAVAPGSSIMPGKLNPVIAEMVFTTVDQVDANHAGLSIAQKSGWLEGGHGSFVPLRSLMNSCDLLARTMNVFADLCIKGITVNTTHNEKHASSSLALAKVLEIFTDKTTVDQVYEFAQANRCSIEEAACKLKVLPESEIHDILNIKKLADANQVKKLLEQYKH